jgi:hypothetical protein
MSKITPARQPPSLFTTALLTALPEAGEPVDAGTYGSSVKVRLGTERQLTLKKITLGAGDRVNDVCVRFLKHVLAFASGHPALPRLAAWNVHCTGAPQFFILTDGVPLGTLKPAEYAPTAQWIILYGIARALKYLHGRHIVHGDLRPANILLTADRRPLVSDLGVTPETPDAAPYRAPELWQGEFPYYPSDVYAFGVVAFELCEQTPLPLPDGLDALRAAVVAGDFSPVFARTPAPLEALVRRTWDPDPELRPTFAQVVSFLECEIGPSVDRRLFADYRGFLDARAASGDCLAPAAWLSRVEDAPEPASVPEALALILSRAVGDPSLAALVRQSFASVRRSSRSTARRSRPRRLRRSSRRSYRRRGCGSTAPRRSAPAPSGACSRARSTGGATR